MSVIEQTEQTTLDLPTITEAEAERREALLRAAEIMERRGFGRGTYVCQTSGKVCVLGAVAMALYGEQTFIKQRRENLDVVSKSVRAAASLLDVNASRAWEWNDGPGLYSKGQIEVPRVLRAMANGKSFDEATRA